jgi:hypothetical protein
LSPCFHLAVSLAPWDCIREVHSLRTRGPGPCCAGAGPGHSNCSHLTTAEICGLASSRFCMLPVRCRFCRSEGNSSDEADVLFSEVLKLQNLRQQDICLTGLRVSLLTAQALQSFTSAALMSSVLIWKSLILFLDESPGPCCRCLSGLRGGCQAVNIALGAALTLTCYGACMRFPIAATRPSKSASSQPPRYNE